ncbi:MAG: hypothetical protein WBD76_09030, partial [Methyloceanibacter sp.]
MLRVVETMTLRLVVLLAVLLMLANAGAFAADGIEEKAKLCAACHGEKGIPIDNTTPVIWGQNEGYLYLQLRDFKSGSRKNALMSPMVASLEKADMLALA